LTFGEILIRTGEILFRYSEYKLGLAQALSSTNPEKALELALRVTGDSAREAYADFDPEDLEAAGPPANTSKREKLVGGKTDNDDNSAKKKRKRKIIYPKNFDPENPGALPNPERWLPKRERTEYKKKMKKQGKLARGPQGSTDESATSAVQKSTAGAVVTSESAPRKKKKQRR